MKIIKFISLLFVGIVFAYMTNRYCPERDWQWFVCILLFVIGIVTYTIIKSDEE